MINIFQHLLLIIIHLIQQINLNPNYKLITMFNKFFILILKFKATNIVLK